MLRRIRKRLILSSAGVASPRFTRLLANIVIKLVTPIIGDAKLANK